MDRLSDMSSWYKSQMPGVAGPVRASSLAIRLIEPNFQSLKYLVAMHVHKNYFVDADTRIQTQM
jgi:hypothetical protein